MTPTNVPRQLASRIEQFAKSRKITYDEAVLKLLMVATGLETDLSPKEAAMHLNVCLRTVMSYVHDGKLPNTYFRSARAMRITFADLEALKQRKG